MKANLIMTGNYGPEETTNSYPCWLGKNLTWTDETSNLSIWVDTPGGYDEFEVLSNQVLNSNAQYKVLVLMEPISLCPQNYNYIINNDHLFDIIFTTYPDYNHGSMVRTPHVNQLFRTLNTHNPKKYKYYPGGCRTFIRPEERIVYEKTKNISCIVSNKTRLPGHIIRHAIKNHHDHNKMNLIDYLNPPMDKKVDGIRDYRFEIVIENEDAQFFSEKPIDSMLCGTIPIYWSNMETSYLDMFDKDGIITFKNEEEFFEMLVGGYFTEDLYISKLNAVKNNFEISKRFVSLGDILWDYGIKDLIESK